MDVIDRWKLAEELNVYQISLLIAGYDPSEFDQSRYSDWPKEVHREVAPYLNAIKNAARSQKFKFAAVTWQNSGITNIDWDSSRIDIESLCEWMRSRNFADGYFIENPKLDPLADDSNEFYAPKLAAAVRAWKDNKDGNPNEQGIEEICKVANWKPHGGASPTPASLKPSKAESASGGRKVRSKPPTPPDQKSSFG